MAESDEWVIDDSSLDHSDVLYRRVSKDDDPKKNNFDFGTAVNRITGQPCLGKGAFSLTRDDKKLPNAGCSVHIEILMKHNEIPTSQLVNWETHGVGRFHVRDVRRGKGGVVAKEDPDTEILGKVHGLIRTASKDFPRAEWSEIRSQILQAAIWYDSDPGYEVQEQS